MEAQIEKVKDNYNLAGWHAWHVAAFSRQKRLDKSDLNQFSGRKKQQQGQTIDQMKTQAKANTIMMGGKVK